MPNSDTTEVKRRYFERGPEVDAIQHDGTEQKAQEIVDWLYDPRVQSNVVEKGAFNNDPDNAYVAVGTSWGVSYAGPGDWVVRDQNRTVSIHANTAFKIKYLASTGVL